MIKLEQVSKTFGKKRALDGVSLEVASGAITGFLGPNGAGKTTTMRLITGCLQPDSGQLTIDGMSHGKQSRAIRSRLGYLPETCPLYLDMTVLEYLVMVTGLRGVADEGKAVSRMVSLCGLKERTGEIIGNLSKGFKQRVGLAQAMIHNPDILILDEPTTGLDPNQIGEIKDLIRELGRRKTLLLSTHILHQVPELCDQVLVLHEGSLVFSGTPQQLTAQAGTPRTALLEVRGNGVENLLQEHQGIEALELLREENGYQHFRLTGSFDSETMAGIASQLHESRFTIASWRTEKASLDHIFASLTCEKGSL